MNSRLLTRLLLLGALASTAGLGCHEARGDKAQLPASTGGANGQPTVGVRAAPPMDKLQGDITRVTGQGRPKVEATVAAPATGTSDKLLTNVGDKVKKGAPMMVLDSSN